MGHNALELFLTVLTAKTNNFDSLLVNIQINKMKFGNLFDLSYATNIEE